MWSHCTWHCWDHALAMPRTTAAFPPARGERRKECFPCTARNALSTIDHIRWGELNSLCSQYFNSKTIFKLLSQLGRRARRNFAKNFPDRQTMLSQFNESITKSLPSGVYSLWWRQDTTFCRPRMEALYICQLALPKLHEEAWGWADPSEKCRFPETFHTLLNWFQLWGISLTGNMKLFQRLEIGEKW